MIANAVAFKLPPIYPITDTSLSRLSHAEQVARLIDGGATLIQLRDKTSGPRDFLGHAEAAMTVAQRNNVRLIINDRVDIALVLGADGVHLGQSDLSLVVTRRLLKTRSIIGLSTHNLEQVELTSKITVDYIAFGPIFETATKKDHEPVAGLEALRSARAMLGDLPLVAIGGITTENAATVFAAGADSVAVIGAVLSDTSRISENMTRLLAIAAK